MWQAVIGFVIFASVGVLAKFKIQARKRASQFINTSTGNQLKFTSNFPSFPFGDFLSIVSFPLQTLENWAKGKVNVWWLFNDPVLHINDPHLAEEVLKHENNFRREFENLYVLRRLEGDGIITSYGERWMRHHRILYKAFVPKVIESYESEMKKITLEMFENMKKNNTEMIEIHQEFQKLTLKIIAATSFGLENPKLPVIIESFHFLADQLNNPLFSIPGWKYLPTPTNIKLEKHFKALNDEVYNMIAKRRKERENKEESRTLVDLFIEARDQEGDGKGFSDSEVRDNILTFMLAGHETTATSMAWFLYNVCSHPKVEEKIREELERVLQGKPIELHHMKELPYFEATLRESMRVRPPVSSGPPRVTNQTEIIGEYSVPPNTSIEVNFMAISLNPNVWKNPLEFKPERFLDENKDKIHPCAAIPFGSGKRTCLGKRFAIQEMYIILSMLFQNFKFEIAPQSQKVETFMRFPFLHPKGGIYVIPKKLN